MPTLKTEVSELSVAFGILGVKPINPVLSEEPSGRAAFDLYRRL